VTLVGESVVVEKHDNDEKEMARRRVTILCS
jgi:hypothetical protein